MTVLLKARQNYRVGRITITDKDIAELERLKDETGLGPQKLLARAGKAPAGLYPAIIYSWLARKTSSARSEHFEFVMTAYRSVTPVIEITDQRRARLQAELTRTGYQPKSLMNRLSPCPDDLTPGLITRWKIGQVRSARRDLWRFVMDGLEVIP